MIVAAAAAFLWLAALPFWRREMMWELISLGDHINQTPRVRASSRSHKQRTTQL